MSKVFRYYQEEANNAIYEELLVNNKCIVKKFCGTGKSLLMRKCKTAEGKNLVVYVFPSLPLIDQFYTDYLHDYPSYSILKISSENEATTNPIEITQFLSKTINKIICITYHSFKTLIDNLGEIQINVCIFDEAHHAVGKTYQKLIFENNFCEKQIFFTATPKNANGIVMYDKYNIDAGMCGKLVYDYSYLRGMNEDYLNPFEIRIDMYTENTNKSVYESIARAVLASGNNRVLTFHSDVNTERDTSVNNFINNAEFKIVFKEIQKKEFPQIKKYKKVCMIGLPSSVNGTDRKEILKHFDATSDNEVIVISSCETIGEGIDTKKANMCVFVDPKTSYVKIIQNIGRIVRKQQQISTVLIPCWVDKTKYLECNGDRDKCDEVIREDMSESGNFNGILNVLSALKQEDEDLYDICLHYPDTYSPQEIQNNLETQGYAIEECVGDGTIMETMEHLLDIELDYENYEECETDEEMIMNIAEAYNVCVEIHTNSLENPVERYNGECESGEIIRLYKSVDEELEEDIYQPIVKKEQKTKRNKDNVTGPKRENRLNIKVHANPDIKVLWNITSDIDLTKDICSCVIDCEVVDKWYDNFESVKAFINENKKRPSSTSKNEYEKKLGNWISNQCQNYKQKLKSMKDGTKYNLWTTFLEEFKEYFKSNDDIWYETLENLKSFINENNKRPSEKSKNEMEKKLGNWVSSQISNYNKNEHGMKDETKYNVWTKFLEEFKEYFKSDDDIWYETFDKLKTFINENNKRPSDKSKNKSEKKLGKWLNHQISNYKQKKEAMKDEKKYYIWTEFLEEYKEYIVFSLEYKPKEKSNHDIWYETLENVRTFMNENKKRPSDHSKNEIEKKLGNWVTIQRKNYKQKKEAMKNEKKYNVWTEFLEEYKDYFKSNDDIWDETINNVKTFINENNKGPYEKSKNETEKKLGKWVSHQNTNYKQKKYAMKDEKKYNAWTQFLEEYKLYFGNNDSISITSLTDMQTNLDSSEEPEETIIIMPKPKKSMKLIKPKPKEKKETTEQKRERVKTEISQLHKKYKTMKSENLHKEFNENKQLWDNYHEISEENEKSFPEDDIPRNRVITELLKIKTKRTKIVVDMGCGKGQISKYFSNDSRFQFINYDHISNDPSIISCDISNLPLEEDVVEICILSLAMWGSNCKEYVKEANRILESGGKLYIIEPTKRWSEQDEDKNIIEGKEGSKMKLLLEECGFQIVEQSIEKFCLFVCIKI
jgi:superfamily II DNA or RNA helicase